MRLRPSADKGAVLCGSCSAATLAQINAAQEIRYAGNAA